MIKTNPFLQYLTAGRQDLDWLWTFVTVLPFLWFGSGVLILAQFFEPNLNTVDEIIATFGLPLSILAIFVLLTVFVFTGAKLMVKEAQSEHIVLLGLTNVSHGAIVWSFILATLYHARYWLAVMIGGGPYFLWLICQWYWMWALSSSLSCFTSLLGHMYCYSDGPPDSMRLLEIFWFMSLTTAILGLSLLALLCCLGLTMRSKNAIRSAAGVLALLVPTVLGVVLLGAPEGFLLADTAYGSAARNEAFARMIPAGLIIAILPLVVLLGAQHFLRRRAFS